MGQTNESDKARTLVAKWPILYHSHQYKIEEELPVNDAEMVSAWLEADTAEWKSENDTKPKKAKAVAVTAEAGLAGQAIVSESTGEDLVGKVPKTKARKK